MGVPDLIKSLFMLDIKTLIAVLVWGNLALSVLSFAYCRLHQLSDSRSQLRRFVIAKFLQAIAWILLFWRGQISDILSVYLGNCLLYFSFYNESILMLKTIKYVKSRWYQFQKVMLALTLIIFMIMETQFNKMNIRVAVSSLCIIALLSVPIMLYILDSKSSKFKRFMGLNILAFLILLLPRAIHSLLENDHSLFTSDFTQNATFITLILLMFMNGAGFLLLMYEKTDKLLKEISTLDPLTLISNRRYFMDKAEGYFTRHQRSKEPLAMLFIDIDHFKSVNDTYGHLNGDEILKNLASIIGDCVRPTDLCCRYGGEEFVVLLHETNQDQGVLVGNRIREKIGSVTFDHDVTYIYTISVGVFSTIPNDEINLEKFIKNSDNAMYEAKAQGRNRVIAYGNLKM